MRVGLNEEPELKIVIFIKGLSANTAKKVDLEPHLSFNDVCNLTIKIKKQLRNRKHFPTPSTNRSPISIKEFPSHPKIETTLTHTKTLDKGKAIANKPTKSSEGKNCFNYHGYCHFKADYSNRTTLKEMEDI